MATMEVSRNLPWYLFRSRGQRYVTLIFMLALFLFVASIVTKNSPAATASSFASRFFSRSGYSFYYYPTTSTETQIHSPPETKPSNGDASSTAKTTTPLLNSRKAKFPVQPPESHNFVHAPLPSTAVEIEKSKSNVNPPTTTMEDEGSKMINAPSPAIIKIENSTTNLPSTTTSMEVESSKTTNPPSSAINMEVGTSNTIAPSPTTTMEVASSRTINPPLSSITKEVGRSKSYAPSPTTTMEVGRSKSYAPSPTTTMEVESSTTTNAASPTTTMEAERSKTTNAHSPATAIEDKRSNINTFPPALTTFEFERSKADVVKDMKSCDIYDGNWVVDNSPPLYKPGSCPFVEEAFNCTGNGRVEDNFLRYRWQPKHCQLPRFDVKELIDMLRGKRLVFVGDSLNRNMWEALVCSLREFSVNKDKVYEISGRIDLKTSGFYSIVIEEFNCTIEFFRSPFLVEEWEFTDRRTGARKETLRLDLIEGSAFKYQNADVLIFNTAHWWTHPKTTEGKGYYQEGDQVHSKLEMTEAYTKALRTWSKWIDNNVDAKKTTIFFRGYSWSHFEGGAWNNGGGCEHETTPITNDSYLTPYPEMMMVLESVIREMRTPVFYLNITRMTDYRKDAHPSIYREATSEKQQYTVQDCSHWCLPGVPDVWNQMVYALLLTTHHNPQYNSS